MNIRLPLVEDSLMTIPATYAVVWLVVWLLALAASLTRKDLDPVTKLMWVLVIIFVPFFGVFLYWSLSSKDQANPTNISNSEAVPCLSCRTEIPIGVSACPKCGWSYKK